MNKKLLITIPTVIIVVAIVFVIWKRGSTTIPYTATPIKIGLTLPLTGNVAFLGESAKNAAEMAMRDVGKTNYSYALSIEDDAFNPVKSVTAAYKLIAVDGVSYLINFGSATGDAVAPIAESKHVPHFSLASDPTAAVGVYNYIAWTPPFKEGQLLAEEILKRGYKRVSIIDTNHPGTLAVTSSIRAALGSSAAEVVSYDLTTVGEKDFRTIVSKIKKLNPDIVVMEMFSPEIEIAAKQMKELGLNVPLTSVETFEWSDNPRLFEGFWFVSDVRASQKFLDEYTLAYGSAPKPGASYIYDLVTFIIKTQEAQSKVVRPEDVPAVITSMGSYDSPLFGRVAIDADGFFLTEASVKVIKNGKAEYVN